MGNSRDEQHERKESKRKKRSKDKGGAMADSEIGNMCPHQQHAEGLTNDESNKINPTIEFNATTNSRDKKKQVRKKAKKEHQPEQNLSENTDNGSIPTEETKSATKPHDELKPKSGSKQKKKEKGKGKTKSPDNPKRVQFAEEVQILHPKEMVRGKRFTPEEDEAVKQAVLSYIESHNLGEEGLHMILHCRRYPEVKHCWKEIAASLPHRPTQSVYSRGHNLFERDENRQWTDEEREIVRRFHEKHGPKWKELSEVMGKQRIHIKDCWRRIGNRNRKKGKWDQEEYDKLFELVNTDLRARAMMETRRSKHGMLRDDIPWTAISVKLETRSEYICCMKWYRQLTSAMVTEGKWSDADDYRLVRALHERADCCDEDVEWDDLVEGRSGDVCRRRWMQMVKHIGPFTDKPFEEQVSLLTERYCPSLLHARLAFDNLPFSDSVS